MYVYNLLEIGVTCIDEAYLFISKAIVKTTKNMYVYNLLEIGVTCIDEAYLFINYLKLNNYQLSDSIT